ncbi:MAG: ISNCY family transposase [Chloroflexi bacterium]|nr:ISNCY family transposase [Chloroflexota bacterium]
MIIERYAPVNLLELIPRLRLEMEPELAKLDCLLEDDKLFEQVKEALSRRYTKSLTHGRHSTPVEVILRMLVIKRLYNWSYEQLEHFVSDSLVLRQFCRVYAEAVPDDTTLIRWANLIGPKTLDKLNRRAVELARSLKVTRGRKLRVDSTVVETNIHHPTDSGIIGDGVRVLSRLLRRAKTVVGEASGLAKGVFRTRTGSVRRLAQQMHRTARRKGEEGVDQMKQAYTKLVEIAGKSRDQAAKVCEALREREEKGARRLVKQFERYLPLVDQAISQAVRRVIYGEVVPAKEKVLSLFEPHSQIIVRHKAGKPTEFGRGLWLGEVEGGIISHHTILPQAGQDQPYLAETLTAHKQQFGKAPQLLAGDRGVFSQANEELAKKEGVKRVAIPYSGKAPPERVKHERQPWFRRAYRFRAGIEGRINVLKRCFALDRCLNHGEDGFEAWVGWGILTSNLNKIAETQVARQT